MNAIIRKVVLCLASPETELGPLPKISHIYIRHHRGQALAAKPSVNLAENEKK
jgi:hypothetical protein